jgi:hypothetical protein
MTTSAGTDSYPAKYGTSLDNMYALCTEGVADKTVYLSGSGITAGGRVFQNEQRTTLLIDGFYLLSNGTVIQVQDGSIVGIYTNFCD